MFLASCLAIRSGGSSLFKVLVRTSDIMLPSPDKVALKLDEIGRYEIGRT